MDYKITAANAAIGQIEVTYSNEGVDIAAYAIDVPIVDGVFITGEALVEEIQRRAPTWLVLRKEEVANAVGFNTIHSLVEAPPAAPLVTSTPVAFTISEITV